MVEYILNDCASRATREAANAIVSVDVNFNREEFPPRPTTPSDVSFNTCLDSGGNPDPNDDDGPFSS